LTTPVASGAGNVGTTQAENPYGGYDPNTIDVEPFLAQQNKIQDVSLDPQEGLYDRTQNQLQEQARAAAKARGLLEGPWGAGLENEAMSNFNIDWQNNLLNRLNQGAQGMALMGNLRQDVANRGWEHQRQLGESAFQYNPDLSIISQGGGPSFQYDPGVQASGDPFARMGQSWDSDAEWEARKSQPLYGRTTGPAVMLGGSGAIGSRDTDRRFVSSLNNINPGAGGSSDLSPYQQWRQKHYAKKAERAARIQAEKAERDAKKRIEPSNTSTTRTYATRLPISQTSKMPMRGSDFKSAYDSWQPDPFKYVV
jgi:hypothetical protein